MALELNSSQQSQSSSKESILSRSSDGQPILNKGSPRGLRDPMLRETTPSTSLSTQSTQERAGSASPVYEQNLEGNKALPARLSPARQYSFERPSSPATGVGFGSPLESQAQKRTATGQLKISQHSPGANAQVSSQSGHSRNTSTASKSSQVSELSHDLRTRLSYAMFKVQNGWQAHSLDELEAMAISRTSPSSAISQLQMAATSPSQDITHTQYASPERQYTQYSPSKSRSAYKPLPSQELSHSLTHQYANLADEKTRENHSSSQHSPYRGPTLAPPVDIQPRHARPLYVHSRQLPSLNTSNIFHNGTVNPSSPPGPRTPPRRPAPTIRTPSQKAAMEKDAVETLMFMSSPGNSGHHPAFHGIPSPVPKHAAMTGSKRVVFASPTNASRPLAPGNLTTKADVNRVLDEMPDRYSSSDEEGRFA